MIGSDNVLYWYASSVAGGNYAEAMNSAVLGWERPRATDGYAEDRHALCPAQNVLSATSTTSYAAAELVIYARALGPGMRM